MEQIVKIGDCEHCPFQQQGESLDTSYCKHPLNKGQVEIELAIIQFELQTVSNNCPEANVLIKFER